MLSDAINFGTDMAKIGLFVRTVRTQLQLTQAQLAEKVSTTQQMISLIEHGKASPQLLIDYGHVFRALSNVLNFQYEAASPEYQLWREMVLNQIKRRFACEELKYTVYSQHLTTQDLVNTGCKLADINRIIEVLNREGIVRAIAFSIGGEQSWWVLELLQSSD